MTSLLLTIFYLLFSVLAWRRLPWAVLLVIAALPSYLIRFRVGPIPTTLLEGMVLIIIIAAIFHRLKKVRTEIVPTQHYKALLSKTFNYPLRAKLALPLGLFLLSATIALFIAPDLRAAAGIWKAYFIEPILFFIILLDIILHHPKLLNKNQIIAALSVSALLLSVYAIYQRVSGFGIPPPWDAELRVTSIFPYPNALALFLGPLIPLFVVQLITFFRHPERSEGSRAHARRRILEIGYWILVIVTSMAAIVFAKSTGAIVGVLAGLLAMLIIHVILRPKAEESRAHARPHMRGRFLAALGMTAILAVLAAAAILASPSLKDELLLRDWSGHVRRTQWAETVEMLKDRPILGAGLAGYKETLVPYHKATYLEIFEYPHNIILNFWSETGLLGLIAFVWLVIIFFLTVMRNIKRYSIFDIRYSNYQYLISNIGAAGAMITLLIHGAVDVPYFKNDLAMLFWIVYALGLQAHSSERRVVPNG